jgi:hypothetical protein
VETFPYASQCLRVKEMQKRAAQWWVCACLCCEHGCVSKAPSHCWHCQMVHHWSLEKTWHRATTQATELLQGCSSPLLEWREISAHACAREAIIHAAWSHGP